MGGFKTRPQLIGSTVTWTGDSTKDAIASQQAWYLIAAELLDLQNALTAKGTYLESLVPSTAPVTGITTNVVTNVTTLALPAGTWDLAGSTTWLASSPSGAGGTTYVVASISQTSTTEPTVGSPGRVDFPLLPTSVSALTADIPPLHLTLAQQTTIYLTARIVFSSGSNAGVCGFLRAKRIR